MTTPIIEREETPRGPNDWSEKNWAMVDAEVRKRCVKALKNELEAEVDREVLDKWRDQYNRGMEIGSDEAFFHMSPGMWIRNILRLELSENNLPWVEYPGGKQYRNWDDFYRAALREALGLDKAT